MRVRQSALFKGAALLCSMIMAVSAFARDNFFDGLSQDAIDFLTHQVRYAGPQGHTYETFDGVKLELTYSNDWEKWFQVTRSDDGQLVYQNINPDPMEPGHYYVDDPQGQMLDDLRNATPSSTATEPPAGEPANEAPATPADVVEDDGAAPLTVAGSPVASADRVNTNLTRNVLVPMAATKAEAVKETAEQASKARLIGGTITYEDFEFGGVDGAMYEVMGGMEKDYHDFIVGFFAPISYTDVDGGNWQRFGVTGYAKKAYTKDNMELSGGLCATIDHTWMDFLDADNSFTYGAGPMGSINFDFEKFQAGLGTSVVFYDNTEYDAANLWTTGANVGVPVGNNFVFNVFAHWTENLDEAADYLTIGAMGTFMVSDTFGVNVGVDTVQELEDYDSVAVHLGSNWRY